MPYYVDGFVERIRNCKGEIVLDGLYHEKQSVSSDFHTRSRTIAEMEIHAGPAQLRYFHNQCTFKRGQSI